MSDLISRQALMKEFSDFVRESNNSDFAQTPTWNDAVSLVGSMPSAQPEIVRCKDCVNWDTTWQNDYAQNYHYCPMIDGTRRNDFYCADAERRTDDSISN